VFHDWERTNDPGWLITLAHWSNYKFKYRSKYKFKRAGPLRSTTPMDKCATHSGQWSSNACDRVQTHNATSKFATHSARRMPHPPSPKGLHCPVNAQARTNADRFNAQACTHANIPIFFFKTSAAFSKYSAALIKSDWLRCVSPMLKIVSARMRSCGSSSSV
jgi:hypothetical protein